MTFLEAFMGTDKFLARRLLKEDELRLLLQKKYSDLSFGMIDDLIMTAKSFDVWVDVDGGVAVIYTHRPNDECPDRFVVVTTGKNCDFLFGSE